MVGPNYGTTSVQRSIPQRLLNYLATKMKLNQKRLIISSAISRFTILGSKIRYYWWTKYYQKSSQIEARYIRNDDMMVNLRWWKTKTNTHKMMNMMGSHYETTFVQRSIPQRLLEYLVTKMKSNQKRLIISSARPRFTILGSKIREVRSSS